MTDGALILLLALVALAVLAIESLWLLGRRQRGGPGIGQWMPSVLAGACLLLALVAAALGLRWQWVGVCLAAAGVAHGADLIGRWPRR
jgi:O-antigen ligase